MRRVYTDLIREYLSNPWLPFPFLTDSETLDLIFARDIVMTGPFGSRRAAAVVLAALDRIPTHFRKVMVLADVQDFSYKEIAETLNIPRGRVMSRLNRGRKLMRVELSQFARTSRPRATEQASMRAPA